MAADSSWMLDILPRSVLLRRMKEVSRVSPGWGPSALCPLLAPLAAVPGSAEPLSGASGGANTTTLRRRSAVLAALFSRLRAGGLPAGAVTPIAAGEPPSRGSAAGSGDGPRRPSADPARGRCISVSQGAACIQQDTLEGPGLPWAPVGAKLEQAAGDFGCSRAASRPAPWSSLPEASW